MSDIAIRVENLGKKYRIGGPQEPYKTLRDSIMGAASAPFRQLRSTFQRSNVPRANAATTLWALKDVSFEVKQGEVVGFIGRNGAGKSTLLKILSRITDPTEGYAEIHGRVGSLLEVGTGFHPELTGRENIYLNGSILGMPKTEIQRKFDEIVAFAEIEKFLDTPVKRYSSGMYVRLAFAVAAHLEPEILLVDEVLAVGDIQFQKKCLGKMGDVAKEGRTVLLVSHNMAAILSLCQRAVLIERGTVLIDSGARDTVNRYLTLGGIEDSGAFIRNGFDKSQNLIESADIVDAEMRPKAFFDYGESLSIVLKTNKALKEKFGVELRVKNSRQEIIGYASSWINESSRQLFMPGEIVLVKIPRINLVADVYYVDVICRIPLVYHVENWWDTIRFTVTNCRPGGSPISIRDTDQLGSVVFEDAVISAIAN